MKLAQWWRASAFAGGAALLPDPAAVGLLSGDGSLWQCSSLGRLRFTTQAREVDFSSAVSRRFPTQFNRPEGGPEDYSRVFDLRRSS